MTRASCNHRADPADWRAETLRLTTFHAPALLEKTSGWWARVTGVDPETVVNKPKGGERAEVGVYEEWPLALQVQQRPEARVDWIASGFPLGDGDLDSPPLMPRLVSFTEVVKRWLGSTCPEIKRMAFGAALNLPVADRVEGYRALSNYLNFDLDPESSSDFLYQINRRRNSGVVAGVAVNRLMKWSVGVRHLKTLTIPLDGQLPQEETPRSAHHCRLELDINTTPEVTAPLPQERAAALVDEMVEWSLEIIRQGDVP
jgi:hypothetical protein